MGAPKRIRKKYEKPKDIWNAQRIEADNSLINKYGLKNMRELWKVQTEVSRIRGNVRKILAGSSTGAFETEKVDIIDRLKKNGMVDESATLDSLLDIKEESLLDRRLQSFVFKKGMALTIKQARQLIVHGFIAVNGRKVTKPSYTIKKSDEDKISYYKNIEILKKGAQTKAPEPNMEEVQSAQEPVAENN
jgi:small subunit ribosomal protein S4